MAETAGDPTGGDLLFSWLRAWQTALFAAPQQLYQPILPGWSLMTVNETNSSAPDTEARIVARDSYGRQLGHILDALSVLISERPKHLPPVDAFERLEELKRRIDTAKKDAAIARLNRVRNDLLLLKEKDHDEYERQIAALKAALGDRVDKSFARRGDT
jgi:hypothetical protein